jgi:hypothetical protein
VIAGWKGAAFPQPVARIVVIMVMVQKFRPANLLAKILRGAFPLGKLPMVGLIPWKAVPAQFAMWSDVKNPHPPLAKNGGPRMDFTVHSSV